MIKSYFTLLAAVCLLPIGVSSAPPQIPFAGPSTAANPNTGSDQVWRLDWSSLSNAQRAEILSAVEILDLDIWRSTPASLDVHLHSSLLPTLNRFIPPSIPFSPFITDLSSLTNLTSTVVPSTEWNLSTIEDHFHDGYHSLDEIYAFGDALVSRFSGIEGITVEGFSTGQTYEGREIKGWRAKTSKGDASELDELFKGRRGKGKKGKGGKGKKPKGGEGGDGRHHEELEFVVQSGQHAREWVGPATALYWFHNLLLTATSDTSSEAYHLLNSFTFTIIPTINPDGYVYSHDHSRLWRKNRQNVGSPICAGIDLNSNWGYKWRPSKASPCSDAYSGKEAFEAYETKAIASYLSNGTITGSDGEVGHARRVRAFVDLHSYGQLFMFPFAHSCEDFPPDAEMLMEAALGVAKAMRSGHGEAYQAGQACDLTYRAPGDAIDFAYGEVDVRWSYSAELRDTGTYGFMLPPSLIRPASEEVYAGLMYLARFIYNAEIAG